MKTSGCCIPPIHPWNLEQNFATFFVVVVTHVFDCVSSPVPVFGTNAVPIPCQKKRIASPASGNSSDLKWSVV